MGRVGRFLRRFVLTLTALSVIGSHNVVLAEPYRRAATEEKRIALTFDDGPSAEKTREILSILRENGAKATFFVIGKNAEEHRDLIREIHDEGHEIGNHTWSHRYLTKLGKNEIRDEVGKTEEILTEICGEKPRVFRPPGGCWSAESIAPVEEMGYTCVLWSIDTRDWTMPGAKSVIRSVDGRTAGGDIILFHDLGDKRLPTPDALRVLLPQLREEGFEFVTVSELFNIGTEAVG